MHYHRITSLQMAQARCQLPSETVVYRRKCARPISALDAAVAASLSSGYSGLPRHGASPPDGSRAYPHIGMRSRVSKIYRAALELDDRRYARRKLTLGQPSTAQQIGSSELLQHVRQRYSCEISIIKTMYSIYSSRANLNTMGKVNY